MKTRIKVEYDLKDKPIDLEFDRKIKEKIESVGGKWYAQGFNCINGIRDICFDIEIS